MGMSQQCGTVSDSLLFDGDVGLFWQDCLVNVFDDGLSWLINVDHGWLIDWLMVEWLDTG